MSDAIREFLISLSYKIDTGAQRKYDEAIKGSENRFTGLTKAAATAAVVIAATTLRISSSLDKLYFVSQRTGASAQNLSAFGYATTQIGLSADAAAQSVENMASKMRRMPGMSQLLRNLGVTLSSDPTDNMIAAKRALSNKPMYIQLQYADMLGIEERVWLGLDKIAKYRDQWKQDAKAMGVDYNNAATNANKLWDGLRHIYAIMQIIAVGGANNVIQSLGLDLDSFANKLVKNSELIMQTMTAMFHGILAMTALFSVRLMMSPFGRMLALITALMLLIDDYIGYKAGLVSAIPWGKFEGWIGGGKDESKKPPTHWGDLTRDDAARGGKAQSTTKEQQAIAKEMYDEYKKQGLPDNAIYAKLGNAQTESGFNPAATNASGHQGLFQLSPERRQDFMNLYDHDVKNATVKEQVQFDMYEQFNTKGKEQKAGIDLIEHMNDVDAATSSVYNKNERPGEADTTLGTRISNANFWARQFSDPSFNAPASTATTTTGDTNSNNVTNHNTFTITGGNPEATATAIDKHLDQRSRALNQNAKNHGQ